MSEAAVWLVWRGTGGATWPVDLPPLNGSVARAVSPVIRHGLRQTQTLLMISPRAA